MGLGGGAQSVPRRYVQNRNYAYNSCRKLFKMLEIYNSINRYSDCNIRAKFDPKIALVLRNWRCLQFEVKKKTIFKSSEGEPHLEYWGNRFAPHSSGRFFFSKTKNGKVDNLYFLTACFNILHSGFIVFFFQYICSYPPATVKLTSVCATAGRAASQDVFSVGR